MEAASVSDSATALQERLLDHHRRALLQESAITPEVVIERGCRSVTKRAELEHAGFSNRNIKPPGVLYPIHGTDGEVKFKLYRADTPRVRKGKLAKYELPPGQQMAMDVPPRCRERIGDPNTPLFITEGVKKADAGACRGLCIVSLIGTWNWRGTNDAGGKTVLADWEYIALKDKENNPRRVYIVFDSDVMQKIEVYRALKRLKEFLEQRGAEVRIIYLPYGEGAKKVGLDDFFAVDPERTVNDLLSHAQKELKQPPASERQTEHERISDVLDGAPAAGELLVPLGYEVGPGGVTKVKVDTRNLEESRIPVAHAPVFISVRMSNVHDASESLELVFKRAGDWRRHTAARSTIANTREIVNLAAVGLPVTSGSAGLLVEYLAAFETTNIERMPCARVSGQMGWQGKRGDAGFLWGKRLLRAGQEEPAEAPDLEELRPDEWPEDLIAFRGADAGDEQLAAGFHTAGSAEGWERAVSLVAEYPRVRLAVYGALAPVMLPILGASNFIIDWSYPTSTGKTITLRLAASCWGNPDERAPEAAIGTWDATRVWMERASAALNNLPLILDDTKRARHPKSVAQTLYDVASGKGRGRGTPRGMARAGSWATVLLSTGEQPATSFTEDGGTRARTLILWGPPFGGVDGETGKVVNRLELGLLQHYGHAGPRFVQYLLNNRDDWDTWREIYRVTKARQLEQAGGDPVLGRMSDYFAALVMTAMLAAEAGIVPWTFEDPIAPVFESLAAEATEADRARTALELVVGWAHSNEQAFRGRERFSNDGERIAPNGGYLGKWAYKEDWEYIAVYPDRIKDFLKRQQLDPDSTLRTWRDRGWIQTKKDRKRYTKNLREDGEMCAFVVITREAIEEVQG